MTVSPGQGIARVFPRTEEVRGSNPLTSTERPWSQANLPARAKGLGPRLDRKKRAPDG